MPIFRRIIKKDIQKERIKDLFYGLTMSIKASDFSDIAQTFRDLAEEIGNASFTTKKSESLASSLESRRTPRLKYELDELVQKQISGPNSRGVNTLLNIISRQKERVNSLRLSKKYAKRVGRTRFEVNNFYEDLEDRILFQASNDDPEYEENVPRIFSIIIESIDPINLQVQIDYSSVYAGMEALAQSQGAKPKKYSGLNVNILVGYKRFVSEFMRKIPSRDNNRRGILEGLLPRMGRSELDDIKKAASADLAIAVKQRYADLVQETQKEIIQRISRKLNEI